MTEMSFSNYANSIVANQRVTVTGMTACRHYAVRWQTARTASAWLWVTTSCAEGQSPPARLNWAPAAEAGYIVGQVLDARTSDPVEGVTLWVEGYETGSTAEAVSDALGRFKLGLLEAGGGYIVTAWGEDYSHRLWSDVTVPTPAPTQDFTLVRTGAVRGTLTDADGVGIADASVLLNPLDEPGLTVSMAETDANGHFCICSVGASSAADLNKCSYQIVAVHPSHSYFETTRVVTPRYQTADEVDASGTMLARGILKGTVLVDNVAKSGIAVSLLGNMTGSQIEITQSEVETNSDGFFQFSLSVPHTYRLLVEGLGTIAQEIEATVQAGEPTILDPIQLQGPGSISGVVNDLQGHSVPGATVRLFSPDELSSMDQVITNAIGEFSFSNVIPGTGYVVCVMMPNAYYDTHFPRVPNVTVQTGQPTPISLQGDTQAPEIQILAPAAGQTVSGQIIVSVQVDDNQAVNGVGLIVEGEEVDSVIVSNPDDTRVWVKHQVVNLSWDTTTVNNSSLQIEAVTEDLAGNRAVANLLVIVDNPAI